MRANLVGQAAHLFGSHVTRRAEHSPLHRVAVSPDARQRHRRLGTVGLAQQSGQPPVEHHHLAEVTEHHIAALEVAVEHAAGVGVGDCVADADKRRQQFAQFQGTG